MAQIHYWLVVIPGIIKRAKEAQGTAEDVSACHKEP